MASATRRGDMRAWRIIYACGGSWRRGNGDNIVSSTFQYSFDNAIGISIGRHGALQTSRSNVRRQALHAHRTRASRVSFLPAFAPSRCASTSRARCLFFCRAAPACAPRSWRGETASAAGSERKASLAHHDIFIGAMSRRVLQHRRR